MKIKCLECGVELKSSSYMECGCPNNMFIDGLRWGAVNLDKVAFMVKDWVVEYPTFTEQGYVMEDKGEWWIKQT